MSAMKMTVQHDQIVWLFLKGRRAGAKTYIGLNKKNLTQWKNKKVLPLLFWFEVVLIILFSTCLYV